MYNQPVSTHYPMGARGRTRGDAEAAQPHAPGVSDTPSDRRAPLRHDQSMDGSNAFSDEEAAQRQHGDESACPGLQLKTGNADRRSRAVDASDEGLRALLLPRNATRVGCRVATQSRAEKTLGSSRLRDHRKSDLLRPGKDQCTLSNMAAIQVLRFRTPSVETRPSAAEAQATVRTAKGGRCHGSKAHPKAVVPAHTSRPRLLVPATSATMA